MTPTPAKKKSRKAKAPRRVILEFEVETDLPIAKLRRTHVCTAPPAADGSRFFHLKQTERPRVNVVRKTKP